MEKDRGGSDESCGAMKETGLRRRGEQGEGDRRTEKGNRGGDERGGEGGLNGVGAMWAALPPLGQNFISGCRPTAARQRGPTKPSECDLEARRST